MTKFLVAILLAVSFPSLAVVSTTTNTVSYTGNNVTKAFAVPFKILSSTDLVVTLAGVVKTLTTHYTVSRTTNTATVNFIVAPGTGIAVVITRIRPLKQLQGYRTTGPLNLGTLENSFDDIEMQIQQLNAGISTITSTLGPGVLLSSSPLIGDGSASNRLGLDSSSISLTPSVGTTPQALPVLLSTFPNGKALNIKGDCSTDDGPAIQAACALAGTVVLPDPAGCYAIKSTITLPANCRLLGWSRYTTKLQLQANVDMFNLGDGSQLANLFLDGNGANFTGRGVYFTNGNGRQILENVQVTGFVNPALEFWPNSGSQSSFKDLRTSRVAAAGSSATATTGSGLYAIKIGAATTGTVTTATTTVITGPLVDTTSPSHYYDGTALQFTSGALSGTVSSTVTSSINNGASWTLTLTSALGGAPAAADAFTVFVNQAVPRKFIQVETNGSPAFDFGTSNGTYISNSFLGDLSYNLNAREVTITGGRLPNQVALTVTGHNNTIVGADVFAAITVGAGSDHIIIGPNSHNTNVIVDSSASVNGTLISQAPVTYAPVLTASTANPVIGNGTIRGEYSRNGAVIHVAVEYTVGSTDTFGTGTWRFSLPITPPGQTNSPVIQFGNGYCRQASTSTFEFVQPLVTNATGFIVLQRAGAGGPQVNQAAPFAWAAGDIIRFSVDYHL